MEKPVMLAAFLGPALFVSLALDSVGEYHGSFTGIPKTGIVGEAIVLVIIGHIGGHMGPPSGLAFLYLPLGFVLGVGFWAKPFLGNATITLNKTSAEAAV